MVAHRIVSAGALTALCLAASPSRAADIVIGATASETGAFAVDANYHLKGEKLAVDDANAHGGWLGRKIELKHYNAMYILIAQSLNLIFGVMGIVNFAHGAFIAVFRPLHLLVRHAPSTQSADCRAAGLCGDGGVRRRGPAPTLGDPLGDRRRYELLSLIITFGLSYILIKIALQVFGTDYVSLPDLQQTWVVGGVTFNAALIASGLVGAAISAVLHAWLNWGAARRCSPPRRARRAR